MTSNCMTNMSVVEQEVYDVSEYFGEACILGSWALDPEIDEALSKFRITNDLDSRFCAIF